MLDCQIINNECDAMKLSKQLLRCDISFGRDAVFLLNRSQEKQKLISRGYKQNTAANPVGPS